MSHIEVRNRQALTDMVTEGVSHDIVEDAVDPRQKQARVHVKEPQRVSGRTVQVHVESNERYRRYIGFHEGRYCFANWPQDQFRSVEAPLELRHIHGKETFRPKIWHVCVIQRAGQADAGVKSIDFDRNFVDLLQCLGNALQSNQSVATGDAELDN